MGCSLDILFVFVFCFCFFVICFLLFLLLDVSVIKCTAFFVIPTSRVHNYVTDLVVNVSF